MKLIAIIALISQTVFGATWTIHAWKDNYLSILMATTNTCIACGDTVTCGSGYVAQARWDWHYDITYPEFADSFAQSGALQCDGTYGARVYAYSDVQAISIPSGALGGPVTLGGDAAVTIASCFISGGDPVYGGGSDFQLPPGGEWWIDFASDGSVRVSPSEPSDFGKWAWDGSINPNYAAPISAKKHHGHKT